MIWLVLDRSTDAQSAALVRDGAVCASRVFPGRDSRSGDWPLAVRAFLSSQKVGFNDLDSIVVGQGPGSFAGIRAALAFAQGIALGTGGRASVRGLPSALALTREGSRTAVVGDARRERYWLLRCTGSRPDGQFALVRREELASAIPETYDVTTPDAARADALLQTLFGARYRGAATPLAARLGEIACSHPDLLCEEPLPIHLTAAVRND